MTATARDHLRDNIAAAETVSRAAGQVKAQAAALMPLSPTSLATASPTEAMVFDSVLMRFLSLEDILMGRVFRGILLAQLVDVRSLSPLDITNEMERRAVIDSAAAWRRAHQLRNMIVHEYPLDPDRQIQRIQGAFDQIDLLIDTVRQARRYIDDHRLLDPLP